MKIILAAPRGFCAGVNMAVASVERALEIYGSPLYVYHEIIHNNYVVGQFEQQGVVFIEDIDQAPRGAHLLFSAHGVSPAIKQQAKQRDLVTIDATCPLVKKVQWEAARFARDEYTIVLIGHAGHDEVVGTQGVAPDRIQLVENVDDVDALVVDDPKKIAYLTQTTLSVDDTQVVIDRLQERFPHIEGPPKEDICYASKNRQAAIRDLAPRADVVLVVGSQSSSNSKRLTEVAMALGREAHLVDGPQDIQPNWFQGGETVLISAGASGPEVMVQQCVSYLSERFDATVEEVTLGKEQVFFPLPAELRIDSGSPLPGPNNKSAIDLNA